MAGPRVIARALGALATPALLGAASPREVEAGRDIYELGTGRSAIATRFMGGAWLPVGPASACRACHGDGAAGGSEGTIVAPDLTGAAAALGGKSAGWLAEALTRARGRDGRHLSAAMPTYRMDRRDIAALADYLRALPAVPTAGVEPRRVTIRIVTAGAGLDEPAQRALMAQLDAVGANLRRSGGLYGRDLAFTMEAGGDALLDLAWRGGDAARPTFAVHERSAGVDCGTVDPADGDQVRAVAAWSERQGQPATVIDGNAPGDVSGKATILRRGAAFPPASLASAAIVYAPARSPLHGAGAGGAPTVRMFVPGDIEARSARAREIGREGVADPRAALVVAVYLEAAGQIVAVLKDEGRRLYRMRICDSLRRMARSRQSVSIIEGSKVTVIAATD